MTLSLWDEFERDPRSAENGSLRASDRDRDVVNGLLSAAYADGRLDPEEFDQRAQRATEARTLAELPELVSDLVPAQPIVTKNHHHDAAVADYRADFRNALFGFLVASTICWVIWLATSFGGDGFHPQYPWPLFVMLGTGINAARVRFDRDDRIAREERRLEKRDLRREERRLEGGSD